VAESPHWPDRPHHRRGIKPIVLLRGCAILHRVFEWNRTTQERERRLIIRHIDDEVDRAVHLRTVAYTTSGAGR
jgi:hypothetical protein